MLEGIPLPFVRIKMLDISPFFHLWYSTLSPLFCLSCVWDVWDVWDVTHLPHTHHLLLTYFRHVELCLKHIRCFVYITRMTTFCVIIPSIYSKTSNWASSIVSKVPDWRNSTFKLLPKIIPPLYSDTDYLL